jgi:hypothetical protein
MKKSIAARTFTRINGFTVQRIDFSRPWNVPLAGFAHETF